MVNLSHADVKAVVRYQLEHDGMDFASTFWGVRRGEPWIDAPHQRVMQATLDMVMSGEINRLIISVPPGYAKTELCVINFIARGLALNKSAKFMHLSFSEPLVLENSNNARGIVKSSFFGDLWGLKTKDDADSKETWWTLEGGGVAARSTMGQVTGFRAGYIADSGVFTGALLIDDPLKPADALSDIKRNEVNNNYSNTIKSRLATESTPIILIMQRIHYDDMAGFLLRGGSGEKWHHLMLPVYIDNAIPYPEEFTHGIPIAHGLPDGWLWPVKHREEHRAALMSHASVFAAQYMQRPRRFDQEGALWKQALITRAKELGELWEHEPYTRTIIGVDPAISSGAASDETGIVVVSELPDRRYIVRADLSGRYSPQQWAQRVIDAHAEYDADAVVVEVNQGGDILSHTLRQAGYRGRIIEVRASVGKKARAEPVVALYEQGRVAHNPGSGERSSGLYELECQQLEYIPATAKKSPDRFDAVVYALTELAPMANKYPAKVFI